MFNFLLELISPYYFNILFAAALYFFIFSMANHFEMWRFTHGPEIFDGPMVSVLIPMRNEESNAQKCIDHLSNQFYKNYEILVLNDNSTDNTANILERISKENPRVKIFNGKPLPDDWYGKPFAMQQLFEQAEGEILLFTDADTIHNPASISWMVTNMQYLKADMISGYIGQIFQKFGEIITVPLMFFLTGFIIPLFLNRFTKKNWFSAAIGQYIAIRKEVFTAIGGCETFKKRTSEDIYLDRYVRRKGYSTRFLNITEHVRCRMYNGYRAAVEGIGKNIFDYLKKNTFILLFATIAIFFFLLLPFPLLFICIIKGSPWILHIILINIIFSLTWLFMFLGLRLNWLYGFLWPLLYLNLLYIAFWSWFRTISGKGFIWKDRKVS